MSQDINEIIQSGHQPLPCPLCGGRAYAFWSVNGEQMFKVGCAPCGLELKAAWYRGADQPTKDLLTLWNTRAHECPSVGDDSERVTMKTSTGVMLTVERYNDLLEGERGLWATVKAHGKLVAALMKIRDNTAADSVAIARDALATDLREIDWSAFEAALLPSSPAQPTDSEMFDALEIALYGKTGNTWEVGRMNKVRDVLRSIRAALPPSSPVADSPTLRRLVEEWRQHSADTRSQLSKPFRNALNICADELETALSAPSLSAVAAQEQKS